MVMTMVYEFCIPGGPEGGNGCERGRGEFGQAGWRRTNKYLRLDLRSRARDVQIPRSRQCPKKIIHYGIERRKKTYFMGSTSQTHRKVERGFKTPQSRVGACLYLRVFVTVPEVVNKLNIVT
jgi:hypothetical protein